MRKIGQQKARTKSVYLDQDLAKFLREQAVLCGLSESHYLRSLLVHQHQQSLCKAEGMRAA